MTNDEKAKAYDEALKRAKAAIDIAADKDLVKGVAATIFPELRESEDERIRKAIQIALSLDSAKGYLRSWGISYEQADAWLEKQKEQSLRDFIDDFPYSDQKEQKELPLMDGYADLYFDEWNQQKQNPTKRQCFEEGIRYAQRLQKEQKPNSTEDMPYITDEHFYEREPVDSFKYKLAEYMTRCCTKKEGPYGYTYGISAETILKMAKEELIKRGELKEQKPVVTHGETYHVDTLGTQQVIAGKMPQKPAEKHNMAAKLKEHLANTPKEQLEAEWKELEKWNHVGPTVEEYFHGIKPAEWNVKDKLTVDSAIFWLERRLLSEKAEDISTDSCPLSMRKTIERLKSLRPSWKPSEEQIRSLEYFIKLWGDSNGQLKYTKVFNDVKSLCEQLKKL